MGLTDREAADQERKLKPHVDDKPQRGHGRGNGSGSDRSDKVEPMRGIPVIGVGGGAITGTRPGDSAAALHEEGLRIIRRYRKAKQKKDVE